MGTSGRSLRAAVLATLVVGTSACSSVLTPDDRRPDSARIGITGTASSPLQLITSTRFVRSGSIELGTVTHELIEADTTAVTPPFERTLPLEGRAVGIYVRLAYLDSLPPADVTLSVDIGGEPAYRQAATLQKASLEYSFVFKQ